MSKLISTKQSRLPSKGEPLDVYFCTDTKTTWVAIGDGTLMNLSVLLAGAAIVPAVGPKGEPGTPGSAVAKGDRGDQGIPGRDGKDSTVPGPKGEKGDVLIPSESELAAAVIELRQKHAKAKAALFLALEANDKRKGGHKAIVDAVLRKFKAQAEL